MGFLNSHLRLNIPASLGSVVTFSRVDDPGIRVPDMIAFMNDSDVDVTLHLDAGQNKAEAQGSVAATFAITNDSNDKVKVSIDGEAAVTIDLTAGGARTAAQVISDINTALIAAGGATANARAITWTANKIAIVSGSTGQTSSVELQAVTNDAYTTLGLTAGTYTAGSSYRLDIVSQITVKARGKGVFNNPRTSAKILRIRGVASVPVTIDATPLFAYTGVQQ